MAAPGSATGVAAVPGQQRHPVDQRQGGVQLARDSPAPAHRPGPASAARERPRRPAAGRARRPAGRRRRAARAPTGADRGTRASAQARVDAPAPPRPPITTTTVPAGWAPAPARRSTSNPSAPGSGATDSAPAAAARSRRRPGGGLQARPARRGGAAGRSGQGRRRGRRRRGRAPRHATARARPPRRARPPSRRRRPPRAGAGRRAARGSPVTMRGRSGTVSSAGSGTTPRCPVGATDSRAATRSVDSDEAAVRLWTRTTARLAAAVGGRPALRGRGREPRPGVRRTGSGHATAPAGGESGGRLRVRPGGEGVGPPSARRSGHALQDVPGAPLLQTSAPTISRHFAVSMLGVWQTPLRNGRPSRSRTGPPPSSTSTRRSSRSRARWRSAGPSTRAG